MIDNVYPTAVINQIFYYNNSQLTPIPVCAIVQGSSHLFEFAITASDPDLHLLSYNLYSIWGMNKAGGIFSDTYSNQNGIVNQQWPGITNLNVPISPPSSSPYWNAYYPPDSTSINCAHSFILNVYDRTINGWGYIHGASFTQSITLLLT